jgi:hypothetical protein
VCVLAARAAQQQQAQLVPLDQQHDAVHHLQHVHAAARRPQRQAVGEEHGRDHAVEQVQRLQLGPEQTLVLARLDGQQAAVQARLLAAPSSGSRVTVAAACCAARRAVSCTTHCVLQLWCMLLLRCLLR